MISGNVNKVLLRNLIIAGVIIGILTGITVTIIELKRIDKYVSRITYDESNKISKYYEEFYYDRNDTTLSLLKQAIQKNLSSDLFVFVEFLNENLHIVAAESIESYTLINPLLAKKFGNFKMAGKLDHKTVYLNGQLYIKTMMPILLGKNQKAIGHFQGVYHLNNDKFTQIKNQSYYSLLLSIIVVVITTLFIYPIIRNLNIRLMRRSSELLKSNTDVLTALGNAIAKRDSETNLHNYRVTIYSVKIAEKIGLQSEQIRSLIKGAFLHDIGKIGIRDNILLKPGKLSDDERNLMKQHVILGAEIVQYNEWLKDAMDVIQFHHEKFDGTGYLAGTKGKSIPINSRIFAISDVFDALTSIRPYKNSFSFEKAMRIVKKNSGTHFDPDILKSFAEIAESIYREVDQFKKEKHLGIYLNLLIKRYFQIDI